jgi:ubiquinone/menaquinone biosynthesis C-methylase UbiE
MIVHNPVTILSGYVRPGDTVLDIGPGKGYFTIPLCRLVGEQGRVIALDIQSEMLSAIAKRAKRHGMGTNLELKLLVGLDFDLAVLADFALAFWMVHEVPDKQDFLRQIFQHLKSGGRLLIAEPFLHVTKPMLAETCAIAQTVGFEVLSQPRIFFSHAVLLGK